MLIATALTSGVISFSAIQTGFAESNTPTILRGAEGEAVTIARQYDDTALRGGIVQQEIADATTINQPTENELRSGFLPGVGASAAYLRDNTVPEMLFRGSTDAVSERDVVYTLPTFGSLRNSMMHRVNAYSGLRGGAAGVGDTVAAALRGSFITRARLERANVDRARMHGAFANFLPKVTGRAEASKNYSTETSSSAGVNRSVVSAGVEVSMPLFTSGVNLNTYRRAQHLSVASDYSYIAEEHRVALEAIAAHINLRLNRLTEKTLRGNVTAMQQIAKIARSLFAAGDASRTDIAIADANVESAKSELDLARKSRKEVEVDYASLTGKQIPRKLNVKHITRIVPRSLEAAISTALQHNPTLAAAAHTATAGRHAARAERGRYGPQVNLFGRYNREFYSSDESEQRDDWSFGVRLDVPLFDLTLAPNVAAARHEALEAGYRAIDQTRLIERQVAREWTAYQSASRRIAIVQRQVNAFEASVTGARKEFEAGYRSITDVLTDQIRLARGKITLENVRHERMLVAYQLAFTTADPALQNLPGVRELASLR